MQEWESEVLVLPRVTKVGAVNRIPVSTKMDQYSQTQANNAPHRHPSLRRDLKLANATTLIVTVLVLYSPFL